MTKKAIQAYTGATSNKAFGIALDLHDIFGHFHLLNVNQQTQTSHPMQLACPLPNFAPFATVKYMMGNEVILAHGLRLKLHFNVR